MNDFNFIVYSWVGGILSGCVVVTAHIVLSAIRR